MATETLKQALLHQLERLPEERLREVFDFVRALLGKPDPISEVPSGLVPEDDPLLDLIGQVDVSPFAHQIDEDLYGS